MNTKNLRKALKMTQEQFAKFVGVSRRTIETWEQKETCPKYLFDLILTKAKTLTVSVIITRTGDQFENVIEIGQKPATKEKAIKELKNEFFRTTGRKPEKSNIDKFKKSIEENEMYVCSFKISDFEEYVKQNPCMFDFENEEELIIEALKGRAIGDVEQQIATLEDLQNSNPLDP